MNTTESLQSFTQYAEIKSLLDRILHLQERDNFKTLALISEHDGEGKSFLAATLAYAYTRRKNKKALIIDTSNSGAEKIEAVKELLEQQSHVDLITLREWEGGNSIDEYQLKKLVSQSSQNYGLILVDTSSLFRRNKNNFDPLVIARQCDASLLVTSRSDLPTETSVENKKKLVDSGIKILGMVYNQGEMKS